MQQEESAAHQQRRDPNQALPLPGCGNPCCDEQAVDDQKQKGLAGEVAIPFFPVGQAADVAQCRAAILPEYVWRAVTGECGEAVDAAEGGGQDQEGLDVAVREMGSDEAQDLVWMLDDIAGSLSLEVLDKLLV